MNAVLSLLGAGGHELATIVALVPITYHHDEAEELEALPRDTFGTAAVSTKIILSLDLMTQNIHSKRIWDRVMPDSKILFESALDWP